jgi:RNA polymerase sigma factor (TIGR02999 family)
MHIPLPGDVAGKQFEIGATDPSEKAHAFMDNSRAGPVTQLLQAAGAGDSRAAADLLPLVYDELRKLARARMGRTPPGNTLQPTALVHEAYLRLIGDESTTWNSRGHFFAAAALAMRQILVDQARRKASRKHGGHHRRIDAGELEPVFETVGLTDMLDLDQALTQLQETDERKAKVVMLRYFAGLNNEETAAALDVSVPTVEREWRFARALLFNMLSNHTSSGPSEDQDGPGEA